MKTLFPVYFNLQLSLIGSDHVLDIDYDHCYPTPTQLDWRYCLVSDFTHTNRSWQWQNISRNQSVHDHITQARPELYSTATISHLTFRIYYNTPYIVQEHIPAPNDGGESTSRFTATTIHIPPRRPQQSIRSDPKMEERGGGQAWSSTSDLGHKHAKLSEARPTSEIRLRGPRSNKDQKQRSSNAKANSQDDLRGDKALISSEWEPSFLSVRARDSQWAA